jgi:hypothetical protein
VAAVLMTGWTTFITVTLAGLIAYGLYAAMNYPWLT